MGDGAHLFRYADDGSLPLRPGETAAQVLAQRRELELHEYYHDIEPHTFETKFIPVDVDTAQAWRAYNRGAALSADDQRRMAALKQQVEQRVREVVGAGGGHGAFVRLSTRSPKDAIEVSPALRKRAVALLRERLAAADLGRLGGDAAANAKLVAVQERAAARGTLRTCAPRLALACSVQLAARSSRRAARGSRLVAAAGGHLGYSNQPLRRRLTNCPGRRSPRRC